MKEIYDSDFCWEINEEDFQCSDGDKEIFYTDCAKKICEGKITSLTEVEELIKDFVQECYQEYRDILGDCLAEAALPNL